GVFAFSREEGSAAHAMEAQVPRRVAQERRSELMRRQRVISSARRRQWVDREVEVLVEQASPDGRRGVGRTEGQAREIDGVVGLTAGARQPALRAGEFVRVQVYGSTAYDLRARRMPAASQTLQLRGTVRDQPERARSPLVAESRLVESVP